MRIIYNYFHRASLAMISMMIFICLYAKTKDKKWGSFFSPYFLMAAIMLALSIVPNYTKHTVYELESNQSLEYTSTWVGFYASYWGALIGGGITLAIMYFNTRELTKRYDTQHETQHMPCVDMYLLNSEKKLKKSAWFSQLSKDKYTNITIAYENLTNSTAVYLGLRIHDNENKEFDYIKSYDKESSVDYIGHLKPLGSCVYMLSINLWKVETSRLDIYFKSVTGKLYSQEFHILVFRKNDEGEHYVRISPAMPPSEEKKNKKLLLW